MTIAEAIEWLVDNETVLIIDDLTGSLQPDRDIWSMEGGQEAWNAIISNPIIATEHARGELFPCKECLTRIVHEAGELPLSYIRERFTPYFVAEALRSRMVVTTDRGTIMTASKSNPPKAHQSEAA